MSSFHLKNFGVTMSTDSYEKQPCASRREKSD